MKTGVIAALAALHMGAMLPAWGQSDTLLPQEITEGSVTYISGGIGTDEAAAFAAQGQRYALTLEFAQTSRPRDVFLSSVKVTIKDRTGNIVLDTTAGGPFLLANLPNGRYEIQAELNGNVKRYAVRIQDGAHAKVVFSWPAPKQEPSTDAT